MATFSAWGRRLAVARKGYPGLVNHAVNDPRYLATALDSHETCFTDPVQVFPLAQQDLQAAPVPGRDSLQVIPGLQIQGVSHGHSQILGPELDRQNRVAPGKFQGDQLQGRVFHQVPRRIETTTAKLGGQGQEEVRLLDETLPGEDFSQPFAGIFLFSQGSLELSKGNLPFLNQDVAEVLCVTNHLALHSPFFRCQTAKNQLK